MRIQTTIDFLLANKSLELYFMTKAFALES